jgi:uncharacterized membrane protein
VGRTRLEAFSDGVIAIIITIMVLELKEPVSAGFDAFVPLLPVLLSYVLSFINVGIYWNNHHHMLHAVQRVNGEVLWANLHLLFWLSLFPFATAWMGAHPEAPAPTVSYGVILLAAALAYFFLQAALIKAQGSNTLLRAAIGRDEKGKVSAAGYVTGIVTGYFWPHIGQLMYVLVALMWLVPDRRIERAYDALEPGAIKED